MFSFVFVDSKPMCHECGAVLTHNSMKRVPLEQHQKSKHPSPFGEDRECFESQKRRQPVQQSKHPSPFGEDRECFESQKRRHPVQQSKHPSPIGEDRECFENQKRRQPVQQSKHPSPIGEDRECFENQKRRQPVQQSKHPSPFGEDRECFENQKRRQPVQQLDLVKTVNTAKVKTLNANYLVSEIIVKMVKPQVYDEKLLKPAMIACGN